MNHPTVVFGLLSALLLPVRALHAEKHPERNCALKIVYDAGHHEGHVCSADEVRKRAENGNLFEQNEMGVASLLEGTSRESDALAWFQRAARRGYAPAQSNLGIMYLNGWQVAPNYTLALNYLTLAAEQGDAAAQYGLGLLFMQGKGVRQDYGMAMKYFQRSAEKRNAAALAAIGFLYELGLGVKLDMEKAAHSYQKAAEMGHAEAQRNLAHMYVYGIGVPRDEISAFCWSREAALHGDLEALVNLGRMYLSGRGTPRDAESAYKWLFAATLAGFEGGKSDLDALSLELNAEQISRAREQATQLASAKHGKVLVSELAP